MNANSKIDLHSHTTASDGGLTPTELVRLAAERGIGTLGITDHDTTDGLAEAQRVARELGVRIVPGVEFGLDVRGTEVHMLGYFFDPQHPRLQEKLLVLRAGRLERGRRMVERLAEHEVHIPWERVQEIAAGGSVGRPHVAKALIEGGYVETIDEAFEKYLGRGKPGYVERTQLTPEECIALIHEAGGVASLAHPTWIADLEALLPSLVEAGLDGLETYYGNYSEETIAWLASLAEKYNLAPTGGSDFHGLSSLSHAQLGSVSLPSQCFAEWERRARVKREA